MFISCHVSLPATEENIWNNSSENNDIWGNNLSPGCYVFGKPTSNEELPYDETTENIGFLAEPVHTGNGLVLLLFGALIYLSYLVILRRK